jgi:glycosyltransferase involved in cell wall biosynthesis
MSTSTVTPPPLAYRLAPNAGRPQEAALALPLAAEADRRLARPSLSCVIPCHNEARNLEQLLPRLATTLSTLAGQWEIVLVDDGSTDDTTGTFARWLDKGAVRTIELSRNFGKEAALTAGLQAARGDLVVMLDADLQHEPELIPALLQQWREGADTVYAVRRDRADEGSLKRLGARAFYALVNTADRFEVPADAGDFRLMDRRVVDALLALPERNRFMKGLYAWVGFSSACVPYSPAPRAHGRSSFSPLRLVRLALDGLTGFTTWPLRAVSFTGFALAALAFAYGCYLTVSYFRYGHDVSGWTTIVVGLMLFSGIQLVSLGIVGEYIGRIFEEVKARPLFVVKRERGQGLQARQP